MKYDINSILKRKKIDKIHKLIIFLFIIIMSYNAILLFISSYDNINFSGLFGIKAFAVTTTSMEPSIKAGDAVIVRKVSDKKLKENDIITFKKNDEYITHRIVNVVNDGTNCRYVTKGDNNNTEDSSLVEFNEIQGKKVIVIPFLGGFISIAANSIMIILLLLFVFLFYLYKINKNEKSESRREKKKIEDEKFSKKK